jgi:Mrp family chromosome partitioning ATPase
MAIPVQTINKNNIMPDWRESASTALKHTFRSISIDLSCHFSYAELTKLYRMIEVALPDKRHRVVQFVSPNKEQGASEIALETAIIAARLIGHRVLFIDTSTKLGYSGRKNSSRGTNTSLETLLLKGGSPYDAIAQVSGTELYFAVLCAQAGDGVTPISLSAIEHALENLRLNFDLIVVDSQNIMNDAFSMALAKSVDGSVMIVEAEHTRAPVAVECKRLIEASGGHLIGAVMNRRRFYIPPALYRLFYQRASV